MMTIKKDKIVVVDVEATCWKKKPPEGQINEIIEVGVCYFDLSSGEPEQNRSILVKPERSKVSAFCTRLTTLTQEQVDEGVTFAAACAALEQQFDTRSYLWASWGNYDQRIFASQCALFGVPYPYSDYHMNIKMLFATHANNGHKVGMMRALKMSNLVPEGVPHRGVDDAWNIARILGLLIKQYGQGILQEYFIKDT